MSHSTDYINYEAHFAHKKDVCEYTSRQLVHACVYNNVLAMAGAIISEKALLLTCCC